MDGCQRDTGMALEELIRAAPEGLRSAVAIAIAMIAMSGRPFGLPLWL